MAGRREGGFQANSLQGHAMQGYFSTAESGWTFAIGMPHEAFLGWMPSAVVQIVVICRVESSMSPLMC